MRQGGIWYLDNIGVLKKYFPAGRAETEKDFIKDIFVLPEEFYRIITPDTRCIRILVGNKGSGKSSLMEYLLQKSSESSIPALLLKPDDIITTNYGNDSSVAIIKRSLYDVLVGAIASKVGESLKGYVSDENVALIDKAVGEGKISQGTIGRLIDIIAPIGKGITRIDFKAMLPQYAKTNDNYLRLVNGVLEKDNETFYVLIDDTDQICLPTQKNYLEVIWSFILAIQKIAETLPNVKPIVSLRSEIWRRLEQDNHGARDQVDHFRSMVQFLNPNEENMRKILQRRLDFCKEELNAVYSSRYEPFFEGKDCKLPRTNQRRTWEDYLVTASRFRPRDTVQLVNKLAAEALNSDKELIDDSDVENTALSYSQERVNDLVNENEYLCPQLDVIIKSFYKVDFELQASELLTHLTNLPGTCRIEIKRNIVRHESEDDAFVIWKLLRDIEFFAPRLSDGRETRGFTHLRPNEDIALIGKSRWNDMNKYTWEIHPCYRAYLIDEKEKNDNSKLPMPYNRPRDKKKHKR